MPKVETKQFDKDGEPTVGTIAGISLVKNPPNPKCKIIKTEEK